MLLLRKTTGYLGVRWTLRAEEFGAQLISINVLLENTTSHRTLRPKHGLSIGIEHDEKLFLLDVGPDSTFFDNAKKMNFDISKVSHVFLSHSHTDHTGGLDTFARLNTPSSIFLFDLPNSRYYVKLLGLVPMNVSMRANASTIKRLTTLESNHQISNSVWFVRNSVSTFPKPTLNRTLYKSIAGRLINDDFRHEGILVIEDRGELILFNSCSHNGLCNSVESVKNLLGRGKKVRAYVGGLHFNNPVGTETENTEMMDSVCDYILASQIKVYTGHCTGSSSFKYLKKRLGELVARIATGDRIFI